MRKIDKLFSAVARSPILWGCLASAGFYGLIHGGVIRGKLIDVYCIGHPVEYAAMIMFFVGMATLVIKGFDIVAQRQGLLESIFGPITRAHDLEADCAALQQQLDTIPPPRKNDYLIRRLYSAVEHVQRRGTAETLDDHMKYAADVDAGRLHDSYALVRVIIWAIPILGFLGTVIGITMAIGSLAPGAIENSLPEVITGLSVAFATTTQALVLSIVLMFAQYYANQRETALLEQIDLRADGLLDGRFEQIPDGPDGQLVAVRKMAETMVEAAQRLVEQQAALWQMSIDNAAERWNTMANASGKQLQDALAAAMAESLKTHQEQLAEVEQTASQESRRHWDQVQQTQVKQIQAIASLHESMAGQTDILQQAIAASGEVAKLEEALNRNLSSLAGATHFQQTVASLAAAVNLLSARLADGDSPLSPIRLEPNRSNTQVA